MPQQPPPPPSPGLPGTLYSGMSSLQIRQPGAGHGTGALSSASPASPPPKAVFKSSKADHAHRPSRRDHRSSIVLGRDHHQAAATAGRKRIMGDDAQFLASQYFWRPFPREMRAENQRETVHLLGALVSAFEKQKRNEETLLDEPNRQLAALQAKDAEIVRLIHDTDQNLLQQRDERESLMLDLLHMSPDEEITKVCQNLLDTHYANRKRLDEMRRQAQQAYASVQ